MAKCFVLGHENHSKRTADLLSSSQVPSRCFVMPQMHPNFIEECRKERDLKVIAFFCSDFPDSGIAFARELREALPEVGLHALIENRTGPTAMNGQFLDLKGVVNHSSWAFPMSSDTAAKMIYGSWFRGSQSAGTQPQSRAASSPRPAEQPAKASKAPPAKEEKPEPKKKDEEPLRPMQMPSLPSLDLFGHVKKNSLAPKEPQVVNIVGKDGMIVEVDPRRVKPLPENPRWATNPGFSKPSLEELGSSMKNHGQAKSVPVCPIKNDPDYDAQLIDGERRLRAAKLAGIMLKAEVREDVMPEDVDQLWVLAVMGNFQDVEHTMPEKIAMVKKFRSPPYNFRQADVAEITGFSVPSIARFEMLGRLCPEVQEMLVDRQASGDELPGDGRRLGSGTAVLLVDLPKEQQIALAKEIVSKGMQAAKARRYIINFRRGLGLGSSEKVREQSARLFERLSALTRRSIESFGEYRDKPATEIKLLSSRTKGERNGLVQDLRSLGEDLESLAKKIEILK